MDLSRLGTGAARGGSAAVRGARGAARLAVAVTRFGWRRARAATHARGAGDTGLAELTELHGVHSAGDALFTVALAGVLFFSPTDPNVAKSRVGMYLLLTIAPFAVLSPVIGPVLDRFRHGRRYAIAATLLGRAFLAYVAGDAISHHHVALSLYPAAFGVLVLSKGYNVARSAATPRLLPPGLTLVGANAHQSLAALVTATVAAPIGGGLGHLVGNAWTLRLAVVVYLAAAVLGLRLPRNVDSAAGERHIDDTVGTAAPWWRALRPGRLTPTVRTALRSQGALRALAGFLTLYLAFLIRTGHLHGLGRGMALALLVGAAAAGSLFGTVLGTRLPHRAPEAMVTITLAAATACCIAAAAFFGVGSALAMAFLGSFAQTVGKLGLDAIVQRDVAEEVRTSTFARSETVNQLGWVVGGGIGIVLPLGGTWGFAIAAAWLVAALVLALRDHRRRPDSAGGEVPPARSAVEEPPSPAAPPFTAPGPAPRPAP